MEESDLALVVEALKQVQAQRHFSLEGLARLLGFSPSHLSMIFAGQRRPGLRLMRSAIRHFPEIRALIKERLDMKTPL